MPWNAALEATRPCIQPAGDRRGAPGSLHGFCPSEYPSSSHPPPSSDAPFWSFWLAISEPQYWRSFSFNYKFFRCPLYFHCTSHAGCQLPAVRAGDERRAQTMPNATAQPPPVMPSYQPPSLPSKPRAAPAPHCSTTTDADARRITTRSRRRCARAARSARNNKPTARPARARRQPRPRRGRARRSGRDLNGSASKRLATAHEAHVRALGTVKTGPATAATGGRDGSARDAARAVADPPPSRARRARVRPSGLSAAAPSRLSTRPVAGRRRRCRARSRSSARGGRGARSWSARAA